MNKETKQQKREKMMQQRDEFEGQNLGNFRRVLPNPDKTK